MSLGDLKMNIEAPGVIGGGGGVRERGSMTIGWIVEGLGTMKQRRRAELNGGIQQEDGWGSERRLFGRMGGAS